MKGEIGEGGKGITERKGRGAEEARFLYPELSVERKRSNGSWGLGDMRRLDKRRRLNAKRGAPTGQRQERGDSYIDKLHMPFSLEAAVSHIDREGGT